MHKYTLSLFLSLFLTTFCLAQIIETKELKKIMEHLENEHDIVVFDLDNTLVELTHERGGDQWFSAMIALAVENGFEQVAASKKILPLYFSLQQGRDLQLTEPDAHELVSQLQKSGRHVIALTSRSLPLKDRTVQQLTRLNILFSKLHHPDEVAVQGLESAQYAHGILFCGWNNKGEVLTRFFDQLSYKPRKMIFVDDKHKYVKAVQDHAEKKAIGFLGIRYGGCDEKVQQFQLSDEDKKWLLQQLMVPSE
jgi:hypothetical protein